MTERQVELISMADIARLAGQSRATVGNWKARNPDEFPAERGRGSRGPLYDRAEVIVWLEATGRLEKRPSELAIVWRVTDRLRDVLDPESVLSLLLTLLALKSKAPDVWERLRHVTAVEVNAAIRSAVDEFLPDARALLPAQELPPGPAADVVAALSELEPPSVAEVADAIQDQAARSIGKRGGAHWSPPSVRKLIVAIAAPSGTVYNPGTGAGQLLIETAANRAASAAKPAASLVGQEINAQFWALSRMNLALHGVSAEVALGDVFTEDHFPELRADCVLSVPPWSQGLPMADELRHDPRWVWGEPGPRDGNVAWIQHCLAHLADDGRAVVVLPNSALFEAGRAGRIRQRIVKAGLLDAVVALPAGLFQSTSMPCVLLVFTKGRADHQGKPAPTLMVDLTQSGEAISRGITSLNDHLIDDVASMYHRWASGEHPDMGYAAVATYDDLAANEFVIDPARYLLLPDAGVSLDTAEQERHELVGRFNSLMLVSRDADAVLANAAGASTMTISEDTRLAELLSADALVIRRGFPTQRSVPQGDVRVMSIAALRSDALPKHFAKDDDLGDLGLERARPGDVLLAIEGGTAGQAMVVSEDTPPFVPSQQVATLRILNRELLDPWYLGAWLSTGPATEQLRRLTRGAGIQRIATKDLSSLVLAVPPIAAQREVGERYRAFEAAIQAHQAASACLEELRDLDLVITFADTLTVVDPSAKRSRPRRGRAANTRR